MRLDGSKYGLRGSDAVPESVVVVGPVCEQNPEEETCRCVPRAVLVSRTSVHGWKGRGRNSRQMIRNVAKEIFVDIARRRGLGGGGSGAACDGLQVCWRPACLDQSGQGVVRTGVEENQEKD